MRIQRIPNIKQQNFGDVIVLRNGINITQQGLESMVKLNKDSPYAWQWAEIEGKESLVVCSDLEKEELKKLQAEFSSLGENRFERIRQWAAKIRTDVRKIVVGSLYDLQDIDGFKALVKLEPAIDVLAKVRAAAR